MDRLRISTAQFENKSGDKNYNLSVIEELSKKASQQGANVIAFHECSVTGLTFTRDYSKQQMLDLAEFIPDGPSILRLKEIAEKYNIAILAGLFEKDEDDNVFKVQVCVDKNGLVAKFRKLHPFMNPYTTAGDTYCVFELYGWRCGMLICYDNNVIENVRATTLLGAQIIFMPHVTTCTPSSRPGAGFVDAKLWENRESDPTSLKIEFGGLKGRGWLMKWLPARAYDNGIYVVFSNPIGYEDDQLKAGHSMIIDPFGDILAECNSFDDEIATAVITPEKVQQSGGYRYINARRPELYRDIIGKNHRSEQFSAWLTSIQK